jgi:excisionase family DNA binding protein
MDSPSVHRLVDAQGLAEHFALEGGKRAAYRLVERYDIPHVRIGRRIRFDLDAVRSFFEDRQP